MKRPKISIIVPAYNCEKTIGACLGSILEQVPGEFEVVVVYTPSNDGTLRSIKDFTKRYERVRYVVQKKLGRGAARNAGADSAKGRILLWTDSDCVVPKNWLKRIIRPIIEDGESVVQGNESSLKKDFWSRRAQNAGQRHINAHKLKGGYTNAIDTKNFAIRKGVLVDVGMFNDNMRAVEDFELKIRLKKGGYRTRYLEDLKVKHNHRESLGGLVRQKMEQGYWTAIAYYLHKEYLDGLRKRDNTVEPMYISYFITGPFRLLTYTMRYGAADGLFISVNAGSLIIGNFRGRFNRKKELARIRSDK